MLYRVIALTAALCLPLAAYATAPVPVSEPGTLSLLAIGAVAATILVVRKRKK